MVSGAAESLPGRGQSVLNFSVYDVLGVWDGLLYVEHLMDEDEDVACLGV